MDPIIVPKPPRKAFNPARPASDLLRQQVKHLEWAVRHAGERRADYHKVRDVTTEAEAARRMQELLPRLESADRLPFGATTLQEAAVRSTPTVRARQSATKTRTKAKPRSKEKPARPSKRRKKGSRSKRAKAKR